MSVHRQPEPRTTTGRVLPFPTQGSAVATAPETPFPSITWEALERQLCELAVTSAQRALAPTLVSATRKQARFKTPDQVLREVLCIASVLMDETFHPELEEGGMT